jgi:poly(A) polymerase Pap1
LKRIDAENITVVSAARIPVLKFALLGNIVDMVFVAMHGDKPPTLEEIDQDSVFNRVTPETRPSLNGVRTGRELLRVRPATLTASSFQLVLRLVKIWAIRMLRLQLQQAVHVLRNA